MFLGDKNTKYPRNIKHNTTFFQKNEKNIGKDLDEREKTEELPSVVKEKAKTPEELYREYAQSGMTLNDFALSVGISRTTLWRKFKNISLENKK